MAPRYKRLKDMSEQSKPGFAETVAKALDLGGVTKTPEGISLLPNVLDLAKAMETKGSIDPDPTGVVVAPNIVDAFAPMLEDMVSEAVKTKPKAKSKPKAKTTVATTPIVNLPQPSGAVVSVSPGMAISIAGVGGKTMAELVAGGVYPVTLPSPLHARLLKPVAGVGGWQTLMGQLKECTLPEVPVCMLPRDLMLSMIPKAVVHGSGGYQGVIRWLLCLVLEQHQGALLAPATK